jgi:hypothetical protein
VVKFGKLAIAALAVPGILLGTSMSASAATGTDGFPVLFASYADTAHHCTVVGKPVDGYEGVMCADILTSEVNSSDYYGIGQIEVYCQTTTGVTVQCADIDSYGFLYSADGEELPIEFACGHANGACSSGRNTISTLGLNGQQVWYQSNADCSTAPDSDHDVWQEVGGDIELPKSDAWVDLPEGGGNTGDGLDFTTGHYYICA